MFYLIDKKFRCIFLGAFHMILNIKFTLRGYNKLWEKYEFFDKGKI
jgi:hypothetical protein